jgi:Kef-type K+ transport system membrane component KefB
MFDWQRIKQRAQYIRPLLLPLILYIGVLAFAFTWLESNPDSPWRIPVAVLPILPAIAIALGMLQALSKLDEMERRILVESAAFSFTITMLFLLTMGMLGLAGIPQLNGIYITAIMVSLWLLGKFLGNWRAR